jgi:hypothetical protein
LQLWKSRAFPSNGEHAQNYRILVSLLLFLRARPWQKRQVTLLGLVLHEKKIPAVGWTDSVLEATKFHGGPSPVGFVKWFGRISLNEVLRNTTKSVLNFIELSNQGNRNDSVGLDLWILTFFIGRERHSNDSYVPCLVPRGRHGGNTATGCVTTEVTQMKLYYYRFLRRSFYISLKQLKFWCKENLGEILIQSHQWLYHWYLYSRRYSV